MRQVPFRSARIDGIWRGGTYVGDRRPITRVTITRCTIQEYALGIRTYRSILDGMEGDSEDLLLERELPNLVKCSVNRGLNDDAATCSLEFSNTKPLPVGMLPEYERDLDKEGWYTFNRGVSEYSERWGYQENEWQNWIVPDRIVKTYQGYGYDFTEEPKLDENLLLTGLWIIGTVKYTANNSISVECRDFGALLLDQKLMPPVVPDESYPVNYETRHSVAKKGERVESFESVKLGSGVSVGMQDTSNKYWIPSGVVDGHTAPHALDGNVATHWLSMGNASPNAGYSYEWIEFNVGNQQVGGVKFLPWAGNYIVYVGIYKDGAWLGDKKVPYDPHHWAAAPNDSDRPYVLQTTCGFETWQTINLPQIYAGVSKVRLTFTNLYNSGIGNPAWGRFPMRAGVREFEAWNGPVYGTYSTNTEYTYYVTEGNISDFTDVVKDILGIAGFLTKKPYRVAILGGPDTNLQVNGDWAVWGDFELSGTAPQVGISADKIDKQPLIEAIKYVKEILGFNFFVDETGGAVFRSPNLWEVGNYVSEGGPGVAPRSLDLPVLDEDIQLLDYSVTLDSANKRKRITIGNADGKIMAEVDGKEYIPAGEMPLGMERNASWIDQNFTKQDEAQVMADMIKIRQIFAYRRGSIKIPANPNLQIDDQIRIYERRTGESYLHYITSIQSEWSLSGTWSMTLDTHWLGERPTWIQSVGSDAGTLWLFDIDDLSQPTQDMLRRQGRL